LIEKDRQIWKLGAWQKGDPLAYENGQLVATRDHAGELMPGLRDKQKVDHGFQYGYVGIWGGSPGVGKSRTAIDLTKCINTSGAEVHYYNGEAEPSQFRSWCGPQVNGDLFKVFHAKGSLIELKSIVANTRARQPQLVIIDSVQMLVEWHMGVSGQKRAINMFRMLAADGNRPHILLISQLNKQLDLSGAKVLEHLVDYSIKVFRATSGTSGFGHGTSKNQFFIESMKMRGAECPRGGLFRHTDTGVKCETTDFSKGAGVYQLNQPLLRTLTPTVSTVMAAGVPQSRSGLMDEANKAIAARKRELEARHTEADGLITE
jgi:hypothetical protein